MRPKRPRAASARLIVCDVIRKSVRRSRPPSAQAIAIRSPVAIRSVTSPPARTRRNSCVVGLATQIASSASAQIPSGAAPCGSVAKTRGFESEPSSATSKAARRPAALSAATSVPPSAVIASPFGHQRSRAATRTDPSGSTRSRLLGRGAIGRASRSKPVFPT
jgi:hypothetical protein